MFVNDKNNKSNFKQEKIYLTESNKGKNLQRKNIPNCVCSTDVIGNKYSYPTGINPFSATKKAKVNLKLFHISSIMAESWHMDISKNGNPAKSSTTEIRFETVLRCLFYLLYEQYNKCLNLFFHMKI